MVVNLEPVETWNELVGGALRPILRMDHEQHVRETGAKVGPVRVVMSGGLGGVDVHALGTVELDHGLSGDVG